jgi:hypothetical protein
LGDLVAYERPSLLTSSRSRERDGCPPRKNIYEAMLSVFTALDKHEITEGQALRYLGFQALR